MLFRSNLEHTVEPFLYNPGMVGYVRCMDLNHTYLLNRKARPFRAFGGDNVVEVYSYLEEIDQDHVNILEDLVAVYKDL